MQLAASGQGELKICVSDDYEGQQLGTIKVVHVEVSEIHSFLQYWCNSNLSVIPIVAVDYSMANLTFNDSKCIHTLKRDKPNDYRDVLQAISKAF